MLFCGLRLPAGWAASESEAGSDISPLGVGEMLGGLWGTWKNLLLGFGGRIVLGGELGRGFPGHVGFCSG